MAESELATVARPYARAAFSTALDEAEGLGAWSRMLGLLGAAVSDPVIESLLDDPMRSGADAAATLTGLLSDDLSSTAVNFIGVLADYDRLMLLPTIATQYEVLKANHEKTIDVEVVSAYSMSEQEQSARQKDLCIRFGGTCFHHFRHGLHLNQVEKIQQPDP